MKSGSNVGNHGHGYWGKNNGKKQVKGVYFSPIYYLRSNRGITAGFTSRTISNLTSYGNKID